jgi:preprotein translocase subunit SecY
VSQILDNTDTKLGTSHKAAGTTHHAKIVAIIMMGFDWPLVVKIKNVFFSLRLFLVTTHVLVVYYQYVKRRVPQTVSAFRGIRSYLNILSALSPENPHFHPNAKFHVEPVISNDF